MSKTNDLELTLDVGEGCYEALWNAVIHWHIILECLVCFADSEHVLDLRNGSKQLPPPFLHLWVEGCLPVLVGRVCDFL